MKKTKKCSEAGNEMSLAEAARAARVQALKRAVAEGTYRVDDRELADSLLNDLLWEEWERKRYLKPPGN
jgi:flagellar biosynthesis anti-sigma factor FlgM